MGTIKKIKLLVTDFISKMNCLPAKKRKRKSQSDITLTGMNKRWNSINIGDDVIFSNDSNMDGFMGLEELNDYDEDEILAIANASKKKKKKKKDIEGKVDESSVSPADAHDDVDVDENVMVNENIDPLEDHNEDGGEGKSNVKKEKKKKKKKAGEQGTELAAIHIEDVISNENTVPVNTNE